MNLRVALGAPAATLEQALTTLREQLARETNRADEAMTDLRAARAEIDRLQAELEQRRPISLRHYGT